MTVELSGCTCDHIVGIQKWHCKLNVQLIKPIQSTLDQHFEYKLSET